MELSVIGCGNMGGAVIRGLVRSGVLAPERIVACDPDAAKLKGFRDELGVGVSESVVAASHVLLAVKPKLLKVVLGELAGKLPVGAVVISIIAGASVASISQVLGEGVKVVRVMPNLPCAVGAGVSGIFAASDEGFEFAEKIFASVGLTLRLDREELMDSVVALSGSGPGFMMLVLEGMIEGAIREGLDYQTARKLAVQTMLGAASLVIQGEDSPSDWKLRVSTPGGTTIEGLSVLERGGFKGLIIDALHATADKARALSKG